MYREHTTRRVLFKGLAVVVFGSLFGFLGSAQPELPQDPINISNTGAVCSLSDCIPSLVVLNNEVYVAWTETTETGKSALLFTASQDGGKTFSTPQTILDLPEATAKQAVLGVTFGGTIFVVWSDDRNGNFDVLLTRSTDGGSTWKWDNDNAYLNLSDNPGDSLEPALAIADNDTLVIAWSDDSFDAAINPEGQRNIFLRTFDEQQDAVFTRPINLSGRVSSSSSNASAEHPSLAVDSNNTSLDIFIVWEQITSRTREIFFSQSTSFSVPMNISNTADQDSQNPVVVLQRNSGTQKQQISVFWTEQSGSQTQIVSNSTPDASVPFSAPTFAKNPFNISQVEAGAARAPAVAVDVHNNLFIAWEERRGRQFSSIHLRTSLDPFSPPEDVSSPQSERGNAKSPAIAVDESHVLLAWVQGTPQGFDIFFTTKTLNTPLPST